MPQEQVQERSPGLSEAGLARATLAVLAVVAAIGSRNAEG